MSGNATAHFAPLQTRRKKKDFVIVLNLHCQLVSFVVVFVSSLMLMLGINVLQPKFIVIT